MLLLMIALLVTHIASYYYFKNVLPRLLFPVGNSSLKGSKTANEHKVHKSSIRGNPRGK